MVYVFVVARKLRDEGWSPFKRVRKVLFAKWSSSRGKREHASCHPPLKYPLQRKALRAQPLPGGAEVPY